MIRAVAKYTVAGTLLVAACLLPHRSDAQSIASRVASVRDGKVRMSFASRDDICGWGDGISTNYSIRNRSSKSSWNPNRSEDVDYDDECMSATFELIAPAGAAASIFVNGTTCTFPSTSEWGEATFGNAPSRVTLVLVSVIPSGTNILSRMRSSQDFPVAAAAAWPAARYIRLLYP